MYIYIYVYSYYEHIVITTNYVCIYIYIYTKDANRERGGEKTGQRQAKGARLADTNTRIV